MLEGGAILLLDEAVDRKLMMQGLCYLQKLPQMDKSIAASFGLSIPVLVETTAMGVSESSNVGWRKRKRKYGVESAQSSPIASRR